MRDPRRLHVRRGGLARHAGGLLGVVGAAVGLGFGAAAAPPDLLPRADVAQPAAGELAAAPLDDRATLVAPTRARRTGSPAGSAEVAEMTDTPLDRPWVIRVVGPDDEPVAGTRVTVQ